MKSTPLVFLAIFLTGCATTEYTQREGSFWGSGYYDKKIQEGVYKVGYTGNTSTRADAAEDLALLRAADVTTQNGYNYFIITDRAKRTNVSSSYTPLMPYTYKGNTYYTGGYSTNSYTPDTEMTIKCFTQKPLDTREMIFDANEVKSNLGGKYAKNKTGPPSMATSSAPVVSSQTASHSSGISQQDQLATERAFNSALGSS